LAIHASRLSTAKLLTKLLPARERTWGGSLQLAAKIATAHPAVETAAMCPGGRVFAHGIFVLARERVRGAEGGV